MKRLRFKRQFCHLLAETLSKSFNFSQLQTPHLSGGAVMRSLSNSLDVPPTAWVWTLFPAVAWYTISHGGIVSASGWGKTTNWGAVIASWIKMPPPPKDGQFKSSLFKWENLLQSCSCWDLLNLRVGASWLSWLRFTEGTGRKHPTPSTHSHVLILPSSAVDLPARSKTHALGVMESRAGGPCPAVLAWSPFREQRTAERTASTHPCRVCCSHSPMGRRPYMRVVCWWPKRWACIWQWGLYNWQEKTEARGTEATPVAEAGPWGLPCFSPLANCWAWNWAKATTHLFICSGAGSSGWGHACKRPAHSSLGLLEFGPRYHQEWISPSFCDPSPVPVLLKKGNVLMMMYFASHSPQLLIFEGSYWRELIPAKWDLELSNHNLPGPCRNYTLLCVGNSGIKALKKKKNQILHTLSNTP